MKLKAILTILLFCIIFSDSVLTAQDGLIPAFEIKHDYWALSRIAQPNTYFDKVGRKFGMLGYESGTFEAWAYPLKLFRNFEFSFFIGSSTEPIAGKDIVRSITVSPAVTTLTYTYQSFTIKAHYITPINEPGGFILLEVNSTEPLSIVCSFLPSLQPMWPAGLGGQYAFWDNENKAYIISESSRKNHGIIGSPSASGISNTPAHMLSDSPNQFRIVINDPEKVSSRYIPVIIAGGRGNRTDIITKYKMLSNNIEKLYRETLNHYSELTNNTLNITTPVGEINRAFYWAKISYDNLIIDNPDLGKGMVAGLGVSGKGGRPGFGWFFGGDTYINSFSMNSYGDFKSVKDNLRFMTGFQREDGKMAHEITQATAYIDWFGDYPYAYIHGDTSPYFVAAVYDYIRMTGDVEFLNEIWDNVKKAYEWSLNTDEDGDGLMDNAKAGLGALEFGSLTDIQTDAYIASVWVRAAYSMMYLSEAIADDGYSNYKAVYEKAKIAFNEKLWDPEFMHYSYAFSKDGGHVKEVTPWSSVGMMWNIGTHIRSAATLERLGSSEITTDWGIRSISVNSSLFEPLNYNYGAVWPFLSDFVAAAQFRHGFKYQGYKTLMSVIQHVGNNALGHVNEVFSGFQHIWPQESVPHQGFCTAGTVLPLTRGLFGLEGDAVNKIMVFKPSFPADWKYAECMNYKLGKETFNIIYKRTENKVIIDIIELNKSGYSVDVRPYFDIGTKIKNITVNGEKQRIRIHNTAQTVNPGIIFDSIGQNTIEIEIDPGVGIIPEYIPSTIGDQNKDMKIIKVFLEGNSKKLIVEGLSGKTHFLKITNSHKIKKVIGANLEENSLRIVFDGSAPNTFIRKEITLELKLLDK